MRGSSGKSIRRMSARTRDAEIGNITKPHIVFEYGYWGFYSISRYGNADQNDEVAYLFCNKLNAKAKKKGLQR